MFILICLCFLTTLLPCYAAWKNLKAKYSEPSLFLFICSIIYAFVYFYGVVVRIATGASHNFVYIYVGMTLGVTAVNVVLTFIINRTKRPITYVLSFLVILLCALSVAATFAKGVNPLVNLFTFCCEIMSYFAYVLQLTYKQTCILGNVYLQPLLCLFSAMAPMMLCLRKKYNEHKGITSFCLVNFLIHGLLFIIICIHYWMSLEQGFDLCYHELMNLAHSNLLLYYVVNIVIFVIIFVADLAYNSIVYSKAEKTFDNN